MLLAEKVACVTGAARGIGLAVAERFAEEGAAVVLADRDTAAGEAAARTLRERGGRASFAPVEVTSEKSLEECLASCLAAFGRVDIVVANAGVVYHAPLVATPRADWERVLEVNLTGVYLTCKVFAAHLQRQGSGGRIICTSSTAGRRGEAGAGAYCASKFGVIGLVQCLALELASHRITVNAVCPGEVDTDLHARLVEMLAREAGLAPEAYRARLEASIPLGRMATPRQVADAFLFLASPLADYITGACLDVAGGLL